MSDRTFVPLTNVFLIDPGQWRELHHVLDGLGPDGESRTELQRILDEVQEQSAGVFGLNYWRTEDTYDGIASALGIDDDAWSDQDPDTLGLSQDVLREVVAEIARRADAMLANAGIVAALLEIEWVAEDVIEDRGLRRPEPED
jgi:hypothetical protein